MTLFRLTLLTLLFSFSPAMADEISDSGNANDEETSDGDTGETGQDEGCMAAAVNPTTALSVGLGAALLMGLRRRD